MSHESEINKGMIWTGVEKAFAQIVGFVQGVILARLLQPEDFGLAAMLGIFLAVGSSLSDCGFGSALTALPGSEGSRRLGKEVERKVFVFNVGTGLLIYGILCLASPWIAEFYGQPVLKGLVWVMGLCLPLNAACVVWNARLNREMRFGVLSRMNMALTVSSFTLAIGLAWAGWGVWAIAWMNVGWAAARIATLAVVFGMSGSREDGGGDEAVQSGPLTSSADTRQYLDFNSLFQYGWKLMVGELIGTIYGNCFQLVIGKMLGASAVGVFTRGQLWSTVAGDVVNQSVGRVSFAAFSRGSGGIRRFLRLDVALVWPCLVVLGVWAPEIVGLVLGEQWLDCVPCLRILLIGAAFNPVAIITSNWTKARGRSDLILKGELIKRPILFGSLAAGGWWLARRTCSGDAVAVLCWVKVFNDILEATVDACLAFRCRRRAHFG